MVADSVFFAPVWRGDDRREVLMDPVPADAVGEILRWIQQHIPPPSGVAEWTAHLLAVPDGKLLFAPAKQILHPGVGLAYDAVCQWTVVQPLLLSLSLRVVPVAPIPVVVLPRVPVLVLPV